MDNNTVFKTTGNRAQDEEFRRLHSRIADLEAKVASMTTSQSQVSATANETVQGDVTGKLPGPVTVAKIQGIPVSTAGPTDGQVLKYVAASGQWVPS